MSSLIGAFPNHFFAVWGVAALFVVALANAHRRLAGDFRNRPDRDRFSPVPRHRQPGIGRGLARELLPGFWRTLSQILPPGAAVTAIRNVVYFNGHGNSQALIVLALYAARSHQSNLQQARGW